MARKAKKRTASGQRAIIIVGGKNKGRPGSSRMLNPQPLPPKQKASRKKKSGSRMLNPQPLPPKRKASRKKKKIR
jgi:hypothetical protein